MQSIRIANGSFGGIIIILVFMTRVSGINKTRAPMEAWKCNLRLPFLKKSDRPTNEEPTDGHECLLGSYTSDEYVYAKCIWFFHLDLLFIHIKPL